MKYKAIIFDMDGTITDTEKLWWHATLTLIARRNVKLTQQEQQELYKQLHGGTVENACFAIKMTANLPETPHELLREKLAIVSELYAKGIDFIKGFVDFHEQVVAADLKIAIATNADDHTLELAKKALNLDKFFGEHIYNISHVNKKAKPDPALYLHAAEQVGVDPEKCIAIEDSAHGIQAAQDAGMFCIGINSSNKPHNIAKADLKIDEYDEIIFDKLMKARKKK